MAKTNTKVLINKSDELTINKSSDKQVFARHETFHPRYGWLKKGFDVAVENPTIYLNDDAPTILGVGKNMVRSIRYWCKAFKLLDDSSDQPSDLGNKLLADDGFDPFLEDPATLWVLHWHLLKSPCLATAWYYFFNSFRATEFSTKDMEIALGKYRDQVAPIIANSSLEKDISCFLRMYVSKYEQDATPREDSLNCPFAELGLIHKTGDPKKYTFRFGAKRNLPAEIIVYACLEYAHTIGEDQRTINISRLLYDSGSPGQAFKLSEMAICEAIEKIARHNKKLSFNETAGLIQFSFTTEPQKLANNILTDYYKNR